jgi:hypothetical protein
MTVQHANTATARCVVFADTSINGRKGPSYDWQSTLVPSDTVFEASLQMMLAAAPVTTRARKSRRRS